MDIKFNAKLNGFETVTIIDAELGKSTPVIFVTAVNLFEYCRLAPTSDVDHHTYLQKPYTEDQLISCIEMVLKKPAHNIFRGS
jgi:YesN/AraC family two-component response regulator